MKRFIYSFLFLFGLLVFTGCEDITSEDTSKITYFVTFDMAGDQVMTIPVGQSYVEPGVVALEGDNDISSSMKITGTVNSNAVGLYPITYSATNVDGFSSSVTRTVIVYNPEVTANLAGNYVTATGTYRFWYSSGAKVNFPGFNVNITEVAPGVYFVSDYFGGYYDQRAAYGANYAMTGYMKLNPDNTLEELSSAVKGWGDSLASFKGTYNPTDKTIYWESAYAGSMTFYVNLQLK